MTEFRWYGNLAEVDVAATRAWYDKAENWGCTCGHCRNYLALADELPKELVDILSELGIPSVKATQVCEFYHENGKLFYELDFRVAGRMLEKAKEAARMPWGNFSCNDNAESFYPHSAQDFPTPCFELTVFIWLPWVLDEPIEGMPIVAE